MSLIEYKSYPLFPFEFLPLDKINNSISHNRIILGKPYNYNYYLYNESEYYTTNVDIKFDTYEEMDNIRKFFLQMKGMNSLFWFYSYVNEIILLENANVGSTTLRVEMPILNHVLPLRPVFIYIPEISFITKIIKAVDEAYSNEITYKKMGKIILEDPLPVDLTKENCKNICFSHLGRLGRDDLTFEFIDLFRGKVNFNFREITVAHYEKLGLYTKG